MHRSHWFWKTLENNRWINFWYPNLRHQYLSTAPMFEKARLKKATIMLVVKQGSWGQNPFINIKQVRVISIIVSELFRNWNKAPLSAGHSNILWLNPSILSDILQFHFREKCNLLLWHLFRVRETASTSTGKMWRTNVNNTTSAGDFKITRSIFEGT